MAITRAKELDEILAKTGKTVGPLHGVPISVKEHINMKGLACNASFVAWIDNIAPDDAGLLKLLYAAGGVFYVRTTQPQTIMHAACSSAIFGDTTNPYNTNLTCGGSSGGEGAIVGMKASVLSDLVEN
jgi:amidase